MPPGPRDHPLLPYWARWLATLDLPDHGALLRITRWSAVTRRHVRLVADVEPKFIPHPSTWLIEGRWMDEAASTSARVNVNAMWRRRLSGFRENGFWSGNWGPKPDEGRCHAPPRLLAEFGYAE